MFHSAPTRAVAACSLALSALALPSNLAADNAAEAAKMVTLVRDHVDQGRPEVILDSILSQAAQAKAEDMIAKGYFDHTDPNDPNGLGPNRLVESFGYVLPSFYSQDRTGNNIEAIYQESNAGPSDADRAFASWLISGAHRPHILAEDPFWVDQTHVGVGVATGGVRNVFVFLSAPPSEGGGGGGKKPKPAIRDTWSSQYRAAQSFYDLYAASGLYSIATAYYYYYYYSLGLYNYNVAHGQLPDSNYNYYNGLALFYYYYLLESGDAAGALSNYNYYLALAFYYYYVGFGNYDLAISYYNYYVGIALGA